MKKCSLFLISLLVLGGCNNQSSNLNSSTSKESSTSNIYYNSSTISSNFSGNSLPGIYAEILGIDVKSAIAI